MDTARCAPELRKRLRAVGLSPELIARLSEDKVDLPRVCALLEYGRGADRLGTPPARRREFEEAEAALSDLTRALRRAWAWYREHVDYLEGDKSPERQRRPVYYATGALLELLKDRPRDPLVVAAERAADAMTGLRGPVQGGRPARPWLAEIRQGLAEAGCSEDQITEIRQAAGLLPPTRQS